MSCQICLDDYKGRVKPITCQYCPSNACRKCLERYLLQSYEDPCCMDCKRGWSSEFMSSNFTLIFRNDTLRKHRRNILFEREKSLLPAMQVFAAAMGNIRRLQLTREKLHEGLHGPDSITDKYRKASKELDELRVEYYRARDDIRRIKAKRTGTDYIHSREDLIALATLRITRDKLSTELVACQARHGAVFEAHASRHAKIRENTDALWRARREYNGETGATERREFIMKCCAEDCRGFLSTAYKCGTCDVWTCPDCLVVLGKDKTVAHTCAPDAVESTKLIRAETMPCPKCAARIFKIDGCDQMWCVMEGCNTAFSWTSGRVITGALHNPHYYEWLRRQGGAAGAPREAGDIPCGGIPNFWQVLSALRVARIPPAESSDLERIHRMAVEMEERIRDYPTRMPQLANKDNNVAYLLKDITEVEWKRQLEFTESKFNRKREIGYILHTLVTATADLINQLTNRCNAAGSPELRGDLRKWIAETLMVQMEELRNYTNQALKDLSIRNHMAVPQVSDEWAWIPIRALYKKKVVHTEPPPLEPEAP